MVWSLLDLYQPLTLIACAATILYHSPAWLVSGMSKTAIKTSKFENRLRCYRLMVSKMFRGLTSEWNAIHKHDTIVIKLQKNKCWTRLFELYWTDTFQREIKHCSGSYESRKNKIIHININWWIRNIRSNHHISKFKCDLNSNRFSSKTCIAFRILVILYTYGLYVYFIP